MSLERHENLQESFREIYLREQFFEFVLSGLKTLELRVAFQSFSGIVEGDHVIFRSGDGRSVDVEITSVRRYGSLDEVLESEDISKLAPNMTREQIKKIVPTIFSEADVLENGLILFEFAKIE